MIEAALTRRGSAASNPSTIIRAKVLVFAGSRRRARSCSNEISRSNAALRTARCASAKAFIGRKRPLTTWRCSRTESTAASPAFFKSAWVTLASPWMNSAPSSTGICSPGMRRVQQRPPTRSRASSTSTRWPARESSDAAARPAAPAPMTMTSELLDFDAGLGNHVLPERDLFRDLIAELLVAAAGGRDAVRLELRRRLPALEHLVHLGVDALDHRARQVLRADQAVPHHAPEAPHAPIRPPPPPVDPRPGPPPG